MSNKIPQEDIDLINHLMKERRNVLNQDGPDSENFIKKKIQEKGMAVTAFSSFGVYKKKCMKKIFIKKKYRRKEWR